MTHNNQEKTKKIEELQKQITYIQKVLKDNEDLNLLSSQDVLSLKDILDKNQIYFQKLKNNEFEIAIVGLEKAGKSTFANALIENNILPSAPERCTFTSTRLTFGNDSAVIDFYTKEEFNEIFQGMLKDIEYPNYENITFENLDLNEFKTYFDSLDENNPNLYKTHKGKTDEEIEDILRNREKLSQFLTGEVKRFKNEELHSEEFKSFIKGENEGKDTAKPRSVKKIEIQSSKLQKLKNAIIYDVPGFDSPTRIHERQTLERLKSADAIILVTNVGTNPSLVGTQLNTITKNTDEDGIKLNEKLFVFGNKIDLAEDNNYAHNEKILRRDVQKYNLAKDSKVFIGSAKNYLNSKDKEFDFSLGIEEIYNSLVEYNNTERFQILKKKIDSNKTKFLSTIQKLVKYDNEDFDEDFIEHQKINIISETRDKIKENLEYFLKKFNKELKEEFDENRYFSIKFENLLETKSEIYFPLIDEKTIEEAKIHSSQSVSNELPLDSMNNFIRKKLHSDFLKNFTDLIIQMSYNRSKEIEDKLLDSFVKGLNIYKETLIEETLKYETKKFLEKIFNNIEIEEKFSYLVERFSRHLFDILILNPLLGNDRRRKFKNNEPEFVYLSSFYGEEANDMISMLLTGEKGNVLSPKELGDLINKGIELLKGDNYLSDIREELLEICDVLIKFDVSKINYDVAEIVKNVVPIDTETDLLKEINRDIENLKAILKKSVIPAMDLELAFYNGINKKIDLIISSFTETNSGLYSKFNTFISKMSKIVAENRLKEINAEYERERLKKEFVKNVKIIQTNLEIM